MFATHPQSDPDAGPELSQARANRAVPNASQTKSSTSTDPNAGPEPTPQRAGDNGRVYAKAPRYVDDFDEYAPKGH